MVEGLQLKREKVCRLIHRLIGASWVHSFVELAFVTT